MAATAKAAGFAGLLRVFFATFATLRLDWQPVVWVVAVLTLLVGSVLAVVQNDVKRMLAYSSISHAGYVLIGLQAGSRDGIAGALFYLLAYTFMVIGSFAVVTLVGRRGDERHGLDAYRGLASRRPGLALAFAVFLMAQAGVPFTTGFLAKFLVISAAVESGSYALALIGMLSAAIAAFFYLRLIGLMYMSEPEGRGGGRGRGGDRGLRDAAVHGRLRPGRQRRLLTGGRALPQNSVPQCGGGSAAKAAVARPRAPGVCSCTRPAAARVVKRTPPR
jgi:NADH-quinone oxidoreductase subunit N